MQVDQRKTVELNTIYHKAANTTNPVNVLVYADPNTWTGAGSGVLGAQDEIAFMAKDAGGAAPSFSEPANVVHNSGVKVTVTDQRAGQRGQLRLPVPPDRRARSRGRAATTSTTSST